MYSPHCCTIFNIVDGVIHRAHVYRCMWQATRGTTLSDIGAGSAESLLLLVPLDTTVTDKDGNVLKYVNPSEYRSSPDGHWTLANPENSGVDCYVARGFIHTDADLETLKQNGVEAYRVQTFKVLDYGSAPMRHYEIRGV